MEARGSLWQRIEDPMTPRASDDVAPVPILAAGLAIFATTHDEVRALDLTTGRTRWRYFCGGPVRFAPAAQDGALFVGSDDGFVHGLDLASGTFRWKTRIGPASRLVVGNGRLISPCPIRAGLLVHQGVIYIAAGLFPIEGAYLAALETVTGRILWRRHLGKSSPQGYLVDAGSEIIVPFGRASPRAYTKRDGSPTRDIPSTTGTLAVVSQDETLSGPGPRGNIQSGNLQSSGAKLVTYPGRQMAVTSRVAYLASGKELTALDRQILRESRGDFEQAVLWRAPSTASASLIVAGNRVYAGGAGRIEVFEATTGQSLDTLKVSGIAHALAANEASLVAGTSDGSIQAFLERPRPPVAETPKPLVKPAENRRRQTPHWIADLPLLRGLALWAGSGDPLPDVRALAESTELHIVVRADHSNAASMRLRLAEEGLLGARAAVVELDANGAFPVVDHVFNLVVADGLKDDEALRLSCPAPSGIVLRNGQATRPPTEAKPGTWTHLYGTAANLCASAQRMDGSPRLQWFGGHGPERMPDRHTRGHAPLAAGGLLLSMAENALIATDARNGTVRWELDLPHSMRYAMPYDAGYAVLQEDGAQACVAVNEALWIIDTRAGRVRDKIPCPLPDQHWGWVAMEGTALYGSTLRPSAPRTKKEYDLVDLEYRSGRPMVCSKSVFRTGLENTPPLWIYEVPGALVNPTLSVSQGRIYAIESRGSKAATDHAGRLTCTEIMEGAFVICLDGRSGKKLWERALRWPEAKDILGLAVTGDKLLISCAQSVGTQASYHLKCWRTADGGELWQASSLNPIQDLFHGQQVKRPVVLRNRVAFESGLFDLETGARWSPPGAPKDWILSRPGHACGGMTGADDGLLFRADNPTFFRFTDGKFTALAPTRPGCWLNILPVQGGVLIPEGSASCICAYPIQASMGFAFSPEPAPQLPDILPSAGRK